MKRAKRRKVPLPKLEQPLRRPQILEAVLTQITQIGLDGLTTFVKSVFTTTDGLSTITGNGPTPSYSMSFSGSANTQYDVLVRYYWAAPGKPWTGPYDFQAGVYQNHSKIGLSYPGSTCYFSV